MAKKKDESRDIEDKHQRMEEEGAGIRNMSGSTGDFAGMRDKVSDVREASGFLSQSFVIDGGGPVRGRARPARGRGGQRRSPRRRGVGRDKRRTAGTKKGVRVTSSRRKAKGRRNRPASKKEKGVGGRRKKGTKSVKRREANAGGERSKKVGKGVVSPGGKGKVAVARSKKGGKAEKGMPVKERARSAREIPAQSTKQGPERPVPTKSRAPKGQVPKRARSDQGRAEDENDWEKCPNCGKLKRKGQRCGYCNE